MHGQRQANRVVAGKGSQCVAHRDVARAHRDVDVGESLPITLRRREEPHEVAHDRHDVRFVHRARDADEVAQRVADDEGVALHERGDLGRFEPAEIGDPQRQREVMQRDDRKDVPGATGFEHEAIVRQRLRVDLASLWLDARPLDRESI